MLRYSSIFPFFILLGCASFYSYEGPGHRPSEIMYSPVTMETVFLSGTYSLPNTDNLEEYPLKDTTVAILTFDAKAGVLPDEVALLTDRFAVELGKQKTHKLISRSKMKEVLELQNFSASCSSIECVIEAGQLLGVEYMIYGSVGRIGRLFTVNAYITSVEQGVVVAGATVDYQGKIETLLTEGMTRAMQNLLQEVKNKVADDLNG